MDLLDGDRFGQSRVNDAGIILDRDELAFIGKDGVILLNQAVNFCPEMSLQMGEVKVLTELLTMQFLVVYNVEMWVDLIEYGGRMLALAKDSPAIDVMQEGVKLVGLIGEATVIQEDILALARIPFHFGGDVDRRIRLVRLGGGKMRQLSCSKSCEGGMMGPIAWIARLALL